MALARDALLKAGATIWELFWGFALGIVVLWAFFIVMGAVGVGDPPWLTIAMGVLGVAGLAHLIHEHRMIDSERNSELSRRSHMLRERRGF